MNRTEITEIVTRALAGASIDYLEDIAAHGIHNVTNDYCDCDDYDEIAAEFARQAAIAIDAHRP